MHKLASIKRLHILLRLFSACLFLFSSTLQADVVKPALIEISAYKSGQIVIEVRASIEALLTGINSKYKNTQSSPMADAYDELRVQPANELKRAFRQFEQVFLDEIRLSAQTDKLNKPIKLKLNTISTPEPGYTKVPRISTLWLSGQLPPDARYISLNYPSKFSDYAVRVRQVDTSAEKWHWSDWDWIKSARASKLFSLSEIVAKKSRLETISEFIKLGFLHILPRGTDHILFILGLFLFCRSLRPLFWQVTMFTFAHTVTLALASADYIELSPRIVEPLIALSIAYVGIENLFLTQLHKHRLVLVFGFGLLHGLGFASVLSGFELPDDASFTSLLSFNLGVEIGQLSVITVAWLMLVWFMRATWYRRAIIIPGSILISLTGLFWTFERLSLY